MGVERVDFFPGGDAAGGREAPGGGVSDRQDGVEIGAAHQPLGVDVGVEELAAVRLERADGLERGQRQGGLPAVDDDVAALAVDRGDHALDADGVGEPLREVEVGPSVLEQRRAGDDLLGAGGEDILRPLDGADAAADPAGQRAAIWRTSARLSPAPIAASRSITCTLGKRANRFTQANTSASRIGEPLALHELDDRAVLEIDDGNQHVSCQSRTGMPCGAQVLFQRCDAGFGVVEDRRGERGVGGARGEDVDEVVEAAGAAGRDDRNRHGRRHRGGHLAVEARLGAVAIDRGQQDLAGAARLGLARPLDRVALGRQSGRCAT